MEWTVVQTDPAHLTFGIRLPAGFEQPKLPETAAPDFGDPTALLPLGVWMANYAPIFLCVGARPAYEDGNLTDWLGYLAEAQGHQLETPPTAWASGEGVTCTVTQEEDGLTMRSRLCLQEDGGRMFALSAMAPEPLWPMAEEQLNAALASFRLAHKQGSTVPAGAP